jgi:hypothetical protein
MAELLRIFVRYSVVSFMIIGLGAGFLTATIAPIVNSEILPFGLPLYGVLGGVRLTPPGPAVIAVWFTISWVCMHLSPKPPHGLRAGTCVAARGKGVLQ